MLRCLRIPPPSPDPPPPWPVSGPRHLSPEGGGVSNRGSDDPRPAQTLFQAPQCYRHNNDARDIFATFGCDPDVLGIRHFILAGSQPRILLTRGGGGRGSHEGGFAWDGRGGCRCCETRR